VISLSSSLKRFDTLLAELNERAKPHLAMLLISVPVTSLHIAHRTEIGRFGSKLTYNAKTVHVPIGRSLEAVG
jgi:hypothetical protein